MLLWAYNEKSLGTKGMHTEENITCKTAIWET